MADLLNGNAGHWKNLNTVRQSLLQRALECVIVNLPQYSESLEILPGNLKARCLYLMCKRGLITDDNIQTVLYDRLGVLDLSECDVSDRALGHLNSSPDLKKIDLNSCKHNRLNITTTGVLSMATHCAYLQVVYLRRCERITDEAVISLAVRCKQLLELDVGGCTQLTDLSLIALGQNSHFLKCLNISKTNVTDDGVFRLSSGCCSQSLKELHIENCKKLTDMAVEAVLIYCPHVNILIFHGCPKLTDHIGNSIVGDGPVPSPYCSPCELKTPRTCVCQTDKTNLVKLFMIPCMDREK